MFKWLCLAMFVDIVCCKRKKKKPSPPPNWVSMETGCVLVMCTFWYWLIKSIPWSVYFGSNLVSIYFKCCHSDRGWYLILLKHWKNNLTAIQSCNMAVNAHATYWIAESALLYSIWWGTVVITNLTKAFAAFQRTLDKALLSQRNKKAKQGVIQYGFPSKGFFRPKIINRKVL